MISSSVCHMPLHVGDDDTLDVFDDIAPGFDENLLRKHAKVPASQRTELSHRDGIRAAECRGLLLMEDVHICLVNFICQLYICLPLSVKCLFQYSIKMCRYTMLLITR